MDNNELKAALIRQTPVILTHADGHESEYKRVSAIIYRAVKKHIVVTAELLDCNGRSVVICEPEKVREKVVTNV